MLWKPALFKGKKVWAQVNEGDELVIANGLVGFDILPKRERPFIVPLRKNIQLSSEPSKPLDKGANAPKIDDKSQVRQKFRVFTLVQTNKRVRLKRCT